MNKHSKGSDGCIPFISLTRLNDNTSSSKEILVSPKVSYFILVLRKTLVRLHFITFHVGMFDSEQRSDCGEQYKVRPSLLKITRNFRPTKSKKNFGRRKSLSKARDMPKFKQSFTMLVVRITQEDLWFRRKELMGST